MSIHEFNDLITSAHLIDAEFTIRECALSFVRSMKTVRSHASPLNGLPRACSRAVRAVRWTLTRWQVADETISDAHKRMTFVEFIVAIAHVAELKSIAALEGDPIDPAAAPDSDIGFGLRPFAKPGNRPLPDKLEIVINALIAATLAVRHGAVLASEVFKGIAQTAKAHKGRRVGGGY